MRKVIIIIFLIVLQQLFSATIYVDVTNQYGSHQGTEANPYDQIQDGIYDYVVFIPIGTIFDKTTSAGKY